MSHECHGIRVPIDDDNGPRDVIDLDSVKIKNFLDGNNVNAAKRADCFVIYKSITAVMETKASYPERGIPQLRKTAESILSKWEEFISVASLNPNTPKPTAFYFVAENGFGGSRYEPDDQGFLREKSRLGKKKGAIQKVGNYPIKAYNKIQIDNSYRLAGVG